MLWHLATWLQHRAWLAALAAACLLAWILGSSLLRRVQHARLTRSAHQDLTQLPRETAAAISANCRNKIVFNCSPEDARVLARHTWPELDEHDLSHLDRYTAATRLVVDGAETAAFTLHTNPPLQPVGKADQIRARVAQLTTERLPAAQPAHAQRAGLPAEIPRRRGRRSSGSGPAVAAPMLSSGPAGGDRADHRVGGRASRSPGSWAGHVLPTLLPTPSIQLLQEGVPDERTAAVATSPARGSCPEPQHRPVLRSESSRSGRGAR